MPERGAGATIVVATVPAKEETPKPVTQSTSTSSSKKAPVDEDPFAKQQREREETQAALAQIKSVDDSKIFTKYVERGSY